MSASSKKVLILYASYGDGHIQVSRALKEQFEQVPGCEAVLVDLFAQAYPMLNALTKYIYIKSYTMFPKLYGWSYYSTRDMRNDTPFSRWFHGWGMSKLHEIIRKEQPHAVVNTFPMLVMPELRKKTGIPVPIYNVITDFVLHKRWIHPLVDKYYVATEDLKNQIANDGVPSYRIEATGIPLKKEFQAVERTPELFRKYQLDPSKRTVLIMAGSYGVVRGLRDVCGSLAAFSNIQMLVVCGKNKALYDSMQAALGNHPSIRLFGFVQEMYELMAVSDAIMTKPGGITLTESIECLLPIVLFRPVPGQERDNAQYLARKGAAFIAEDADSVIRLIRDLLENEDKRNASKITIAELRKEGSTQRIVQDILADLEQSRNQGQQEASAASEVRRVSSERIS